MRSSDLLVTWGQLFLLHASIFAASIVSERMRERLVLIYMILAFACLLLAVLWRK